MTLRIAGHWSAGARRGCLHSFRSAVVLGLAAIALGACSGSATLGEGTSLAQAGQAAATQMQQNITLSQATVTSFKRALAFNDGYYGAPDASKAKMAAIAGLQKALVPYGKMLGSLASAYQAMGSLASYDATGGFNSSIDSLSKDAASLGQALNKPFSIPADVSGGVKAVGGFILTGVQAGDVKDASRKIEAILEKVTDALGASRLRSDLVATQQLVQDDLSLAAANLLSQGALSYSPVLDSLGAPLGLKSGTGSDAVVKGNANVKNGLKSVAGEMIQEQYDAVAKSYDTCLAALNALKDQHKKLEAGEPVNIDTIIGALAQLQGLASSLTPAKGK